MKQSTKENILIIIITLMIGMNLYMYFSIEHTHALFLQSIQNYNSQIAKIKIN